MEKIERTIRNLGKHNIKGYFVESKEDVTTLLETMVKEGEKVTVGGSQTLFQCGVIDWLRNGKFDYLDRYDENKTREEVLDVFRQASFCDSYITSTNALTEEGEMLNVDGHCNRISAIVHGPKQVVVIVGINKIVKDLDEAVLRVKKFAAPLNAKRLKKNTYCAEHGRCISIEDEKTKYKLGAGCDSEDRICCNYVVSSYQQVKNRIKVVIVGESFGY
jgi:L-lactate utilization protein LutB